MKKLFTTIISILYLVSTILIFAPKTAVAAVQASRVPVDGQLFKFDDSPNIYRAGNIPSADGTIYNGFYFLPVQSPAYLSIMGKNKPIVTYPAAARSEMDIFGPYPFTEFLPDGTLFSPNTKDIYVVSNAFARPIATMEAFYQYGYNLNQVHWNSGPISGVDLDPTPLAAIPRNLPGTVFKVNNSPDYFFLNDGIQYIPTVDILEQILAVYPVVNVDRSTVDAYPNEGITAQFLAGSLVKYGPSYYMVGGYFGGKGANFTNAKRVKLMRENSARSIGMYSLSKLWYVPTEQEIWNMGYLPEQAIEIDHATFVALGGELEGWNASTGMIDFWWEPWAIL